MKSRIIFCTAAIVLLGMLCGCARTTFVTLPERPVAETHPASVTESPRQPTAFSEETSEPLVPESTEPSSAVADIAHSAESVAGNTTPVEETAATELPQDTTAETEPPAQEIDLSALAASARAALAGGCTAGADGTLDMLAQSWASQYLSSGSSDCAAFLQANGVDAAVCGGNLVIFDLGWAEADMASVFAAYDSTQALCRNGEFTAFGVGAVEADGVICIGCIFTG